ncbi:MAG: hypothetical protein M3Q38_09105, partial [Chloroflexota bacterium]|nr:hypothetical protein [Chloroflexota bacterium]
MQSLNSGLKSIAARAAKVNPRFAVAALGSIVGVALILFSVPQLVPILRDVPRDFLAGGAANLPGEPDPSLGSSVSPVRGAVSGANPTALLDPSDASDDAHSD